MNRKYVLVSLSILASLPTLAFASDWNVIAADMSKFVLSIDLQSITPVGLPPEGKRQAWFKSVFMADWPIVKTELGAKQAARRIHFRK
jgi:hypothetical protein